MRFFLTTTALLAVASLIACGRESDITPQQKAKMTAEILLDKPACQPLAARLKAPDIDAATVSRIYHDAVTEHCLKPTV